LLVRVSSTTARREFSGLGTPPGRAISAKNVLTSAPRWIVTAEALVRDANERSRRRGQTAEGVWEQPLRLAHRSGQTGAAT